MILFCGVIFASGLSAVREVASSRANLERVLREEITPGRYVADASGSRRVEKAVASLEASLGGEEGTTCFPMFPRDLMQIDGTWKLWYTNNAPQPLPRGALDVVPSFGAETRVFQRIDVMRRRVVNIVCIDPPADESLGETVLKRLPFVGPPLVKAASRFELDHAFTVDGEERVRQAASTKRLRIELERVARIVDGDFADVPSPLRELLFQPELALDLPPPLKALNAVGPAGTFDTTFCDDTIRVSRGVSPIGRELRVFLKVDPAQVPYVRPPTFEEDIAAAAA